MAQEFSMKRAIKYAEAITGKNRKDIGEALGVTRQRVNTLAQGVHKPRASTIRKVAGAFDMDAIDFIELGQREDL